MNASVSTFHRGEQAIQQRLGVRDKMERFGRQVIRDYMPNQHMEFYSQLPFIFVGHADSQGRPWASMLMNSPGFIESLDARHIRINTKPFAGDPLAESLILGRPLGLLGIELETRRRNRLSTHIEKLSESSIDLGVDQAFGNCPQYIQQRSMHKLDDNLLIEQEIISINRLDQTAIELIAQSDTFFVASYMTDGSGSLAEGADISHRGGKPGFIRVDDNKTLTIPDYAGNFHFNTLGNFVENPQAGLLFIDFSNGHLLSLTGNVEILWESEETRFFSGAERLWKFHLQQGRWLKNALPFRWTLESYAATTQLTGNWQQAVAAKKSIQLKNSWQQYRLAKIVQESQLIKSFYLQAPEGVKPQFMAGQFITLKATINDQQQIRTYTVSTTAADEYLRISIKHEKGADNIPEGIFSSYMHQQIKTGDQLLAKVPTGEFIFNTPAHRTALLLSAGIGITPMLAMARHVQQLAVSKRIQQKLIVICSARNAAERAFYKELNQLAAQSNGNIRVYWALSQPESYLTLGEDYDFHGRISRDWLQGLVVRQDVDVYLCGPNGFMQNQYDNLISLGIKDSHIFTESFGPASLSRVGKKSDPVQLAESAMVSFSQSNFEQAWTKQDGSLLEFAEAHGLRPDYGCRSGQCGACKVKLLKGSVCYPQQISSSLENDEILLCSAFPAVDKEDGISQLEIDI